MEAENHTPDRRDQEILRDTSICVRCGSCRTLCPVYDELEDETISPRGKVALGEWLASHRLSGRRATARTFSTCLLCLACEANCPNSVKTESIFLNTRRALAEGRGETSFLKRIAFREILGTASGRKIISPLLSLAGAFFGRGERLQPGPLICFLQGRFQPRRGFPLPRPGEKKEIIQPPVSAGLPRIFLFSGCLVDLFYPGIARAAISLIGRTGAGVIWPEVGICCGLPLLAGGDEKGARDLARRNVELISGFQPDLIVSPCPSCARFLKDRLPELAADDSRAAELGKKVVDLSRYLIDESGMDLKPSGDYSGSITYHDPCHLGRGFEITREPRELISRIPGSELIELADANRCCGFGGSFAFEHPEVSKKILDRKVETIQNTGAGTVATACPGCIMQIEEGLSRAGSPVKVRHLYEII